MRGSLSVLIAALLAGCSPSGGGIPGDAVRIPADAETDPIIGMGDAADDPAIWLHPSDPSKSLIIGTHKKGGGLEVYDLNGTRLSSYPQGSFNNVDLRYGMNVGSETIDIIATNNRTDDTVALFSVNPAARTLSRINAGALPSLSNSYGLCMYRNPATDRFYVFVTNKNGKVVQLELFASGSAVDGREVRRFDAGGQSEGCVADDETGYLYIGEEATGIWRYGANPKDGTDRVLIDGTGINGHLRADIEGLALYKRADGSGYLLASSQGNNTFCVYDRQSGIYRGRFTIAAGEIDKVSHTDGIEAISTPLGESYGRGLFVAQDNSDMSGNAQNFKLVDFGKILDAMALP